MALDILYFDYWSRGIRHFAMMDLHLRSEGLSTLLIHMGSQRGELPYKNQVISEIKCTDLSFYGNDLVKMLILERPKVVVLLNNQTEDKIIVRACRNLGIKTIFLMHGALVPQEKTQELEEIIDSAFGIAERVKRIPRYLRLFRNYLCAAKISKFSHLLDPEIYLYFVRHAWSPGLNQSGRFIYRDSHADLALVYSEDDKDLFSNCYGYHLDQIKVVGNYSFDDLYDYHQQCLTEVCNKDLKKYLLYIESGFADPKYLIPGWTEDLVADEVIALADICDEFGYRLILKLHPSSDYSVLLNRVVDHLNIEVVLHCDLNKLVSSASLVAGQSSSLLLLGLVLQKQLILLDLFPLKIKITTYVDRKLGTVIKSIDEFRTLLINLRNGILPNTLCNKSLWQFIGPFDGKASLRISKMVISLASLESEK